MDKTIQKPPRKIKLFATLKNGVITGSANNDPAGIATFAQIGVLTGYGLIWLLILVTPLVIALEEMSGRIGIVTRTGLNKLIRRTYGTFLAKTVAIVLIVCNIATIGANIAAMSEIIGDFTKLHWGILVPIILTIITAWLVISSYTTISKYLLWMSVVMLLYLLALFAIDINPQQIAHDLWPVQLSNTSGFAVAAVALIGAVIAPSLLFWQTTEEVEEKRLLRDIPREHISIKIGFLYSSIISLAIIILAATIFTSNTVITSAGQMAQLLRPLIGSWAFILFAIGMIVSGLLNIPILAASTAYAVAESLNLPAGLSKKIRAAKGFYSVLIGTLAISGLIMFTNISPMLMLFYTQALNGLLLPILIITIMMIANNSSIMGRHRNSRLSNLLGVISLIIILGFDTLLLTKLL
ncbi:MAG: divalent metal cation transporter [Patescibacteria group bacterium]